MQRLAGRSLDDFFITYRYAANLAAGDGFVFNPGERVYGVTEPAMVFWLAFWNRLTGVPIHWLGTVTAAVGLLATAGLMLWQGMKEQRFLAAFLGGTLVMISTFLWGIHGAGVPMVLALLTAAAVCGGERPGLAGGLASAAVCFRPDAGVGLAALGLLLWAERKRFPWRFALVAAAGLLAGLLASQLYFGTVVPNTLIAKRSFAAWDPAERASGAAFWIGAVPLLRRHLGPLWVAVIAAGIAGQQSLWRHGGRPGRLLVLFGGSMAVLYPLLGVPFFAWYAVPTVTALLFGLGFAADSLARFLTARSPRAARLQPALAVLLLLPLAGSAVLGGWQWVTARGGLPHYESYRAAGLWIRDHTDPSAEVSAVEVGTLAYWSERHVEDLLGLVTPGALPFVAQKNLEGAFRNHPTELLVLKPSLEGLVGPLRKKRWFRKQYAEAARFPAGGGEDVVILRRRDRAGR